jgi:hypothetical protein
MKKFWIEFTNSFCKLDRLSTKENLVQNTKKSNLQKKELVSLFKNSFIALAPTQNV